ncbi:MAG: cyclic-di-AMP receptor [Chloroflexi bacterium]|nr:cyclic-di-AMP receptor [Chloroflexota bacterium]
MKLIIAILRDSDNDTVSRALTSNGYRVTLIASTGGFFRRGSTTQFIGLDDDQVEGALKIIRENCAPMGEHETSRGTIFVLPVENYTQL